MYNKDIKRPIDKTVKNKIKRSKRFNEDNEIEVISIKVTNSQGEKEDGLMIHYGAELWKTLGGLRLSSTMMFVSPKKYLKEVLLNLKCEKNSRIYERVSGKLSGRIIRRIKEASKER